MKRRDEYVLKMQEKLDHLNQMITEFEDQAEKKAQLVQVKFLEEKSKLNAQAEQIHDKLNEMRVATEAGWEQLADGKEALHHALVASLHYFKTELKSHQATKEEK